MSYLLRTLDILIIHNKNESYSLIDELAKGRKMEKILRQEKK